MIACMYLHCTLILTVTGTSKEEKEPLLQSESFRSDYGSDGYNGIANIESGKSDKKAINFFRAFLIPGVLVVRII